MKENNLVFVTANTNYGAVTRAYLNITKEAALARFRIAYPQMSSSNIAVVPFNDEIHFNLRITTEDIVEID